MKRRRIILSLLLTVIAAVTVVLPVSAVSYGGGSVQGYAAERQLDNGTIVQLTESGSNKVKPAQLANLSNMFGVTVDRSQLLVSSSNGLENEVYVAVSGTYNVLVSTQGGAIKVGDYITMSSVDGVGMKASQSQKIVFGRATQAFDGKGVILGQTDIKDTSGKTTQTVKLGSIPVTINIQHNPDVKSTKVDVPQWLQRIGEQIAEKQVDPIRIYLSVAITAASIIAAAAMLYSGIRNSVISIGRNPMSKKMIFRALLQVIVSGLLILIVGLFAVYLLLKL